MSHLRQLTGKALLDWHQKHKHLSQSEQAVILGITLESLRTRLKTAGKPRGLTKSKFPPVKRITYLPEGHYSDPEFLKQAIQVTSITQIKKHFKVHYNEIAKYLKLYGLDQKFKKEQHPCDNRQWLFYYYWIKKLNVAKLAKRAGVAYGTVMNWLTKHRIPIRHLGISKKQKFHENYIQFFRDVRNCKWLSVIYHKPDSVTLFVKLHKRYIVKLFFRNVIQNGQDVTKWQKPSIKDLDQIWVPTKESDLTSNKSLNPVNYKTSMIFKDHPIHRILAHMQFWDLFRKMNGEFSWDKEDLLEDLKNCRESQRYMYNTNRTWYFSGMWGNKKQRGRRIAYHCFGLSEYVYRNKFSSMNRYLYYHNHRYFDKFAQPTISDLLDRMVQRTCTRKHPDLLPDPNLLRYILTDIRPGTILDLWPNKGLNAISAHLADAHYYCRTINDQQINKLKDIGIVAYKEDPYRKYDLLLCFSKKYKLLPWALEGLFNRADKLLIFARHYQINETCDILRPERIFKIINRYKTKLSPIYLLLLNPKDTLSGIESRLEQYPDHLFVRKNTR